MRKRDLHENQQSRWLGRLRYVESAVDVVGFDGTLTPLRPLRGTRSQARLPHFFEGIVNGEYGTQDRATVLRGRLADPNLEVQFVMSATGATGAGCTSARLCHSVLCSAAGGTRSSNDPLTHLGRVIAPERFDC